jgi:hypothetical protein
MYTRVRTMKALQAIQVTVHFDKRPMTAILSREALEAVAGTGLAGEDAMLDAFRRHQQEIERIILARCIGSARKTVVFWGAGDITMPGDAESSAVDRRAGEAAHRDRR